MRKNNVQNEIMEKIKNGALRDELETQYNKGTVTKVFNKLKNKETINITDKENEIENILRSLFILIDKSEGYEVNIKISKKIKNENPITTKVVKEVEKIENPFEIYNKFGSEECLKHLLKIKKKNLQNIIKQYFSLETKYRNKYSVEELSKYIIKEVERNMNIGEYFR